MHAFARLLDRLIYTPARNAKLKLIADYLIAAPDPERGWALAALTGGLKLPAVKASQIRAAVEGRVDPELFYMSYSFVGDLAETTALIWPAPPIPAGPEPTLPEVIDAMLSATRAEAPRVLTGFLDRLDADGRFALLKLVTGELRVGVSARLARTAFAQAFGVALDDVEEVWSCVHAPYPTLFAWALGHADKPHSPDRPVFRPFMLAHPLEGATIDLKDYAAEWKWDGIRVQAQHVGRETRLFSRAGDDITAGFPDVAEAFRVEGVVDGELMIRGSVQGGEAGSFNALQQRLNRKSVSAKALMESPAFVRLYDILFDGDEDLRALPWAERRARLEAFAHRLPPERFDVSTLVQVASMEDLERHRSGARDAAIEGLMLKRRDSPYVAGRKTGLWWKWKRDPLTADCVVMYAQRGHGRRSSFYSDYTFGCWTADGKLLPVGKAYSGITDEELAMLDRWVRNHTTSRFGPVREVEKTMVFEIAFDSIHESPRHKSGVAMRFPRIARIRLDKPAAEADTVEGLRKLIT
ncbi:MAG: cisplatin damage response ATP-dependent DNA ligase [Sphingomonadaceae bacterium]|nr:cisplatin damage response ATP-dependent DNA ligase [Sphingomonadaceae bacterium]